MLRAVTLAGLLFITAGSALAQGMTAPPAGAGHRTTGPCAADRQKYCKGGVALVDCLESHKAQLAPVCGTRMEPMFKMRDQMRSKTNAPGMNMQSQPPGAKPPG